VRIVEDDDEDESNKAFLTLSLNHLRRAVAHHLHRAADKILL
jgi:hypothetical protein